MHAALLPWLCEERSVQRPPTADALQALRVLDARARCGQLRAGPSGATLRVRAGALRDSRNHALTHTMTHAMAHAKKPTHVPHETER